MTYPFKPVTVTPWTRRRVVGAIASLASGLNPTLARAGSFPSKPIKLVVPYPPGAGSDAVGRLLAQGLARELKTPVVVQNVAGATGRIGTAQVARSEPDGYTLGMGFSSTHAIAPALYPELPYAPEQDFVAVSPIGVAKTVVLAQPGFSARSMAQLIEAARRAPSPLPFGSWGVGSIGHLVIQSITLATGVPFTHVPYKGVAPLLQDLLAEQLPLASVDIASALPLLQQGRFRALAITGRERSPWLPDVPTLQQAGIPLETDGWYALFAPVRTPAAIVKQIADTMAVVLASAEVAVVMGRLGMQPSTLGRAAFETQWHEDAARWRRLVVATGVTGE